MSVLAGGLGPGRNDYNFRLTLVPRSFHSEVLHPPLLEV